MIRVTATGAAGSGTRLLARILDASPDIEGRHDATHGADPAETSLVAIIARDEEAGQAAFMERFAEVGPGGIPNPDESRALIAERYPGSLVVRYEALVEDPDAVIARIAEWFGVEPWPCPEHIYDGNAKWTGEAE
jgi:hypothetical protein